MKNFRKESGVFLSFYIQNILLSRYAKPINQGVSYLFSHIYFLCFLFGIDISIS